MSVGSGEHGDKLRGSPGVHDGLADGPQAVVGDAKSGVLKLSSFKYTNIGIKQHRERRTNANLNFDPAANFKLPFNWLFLERTNGCWKVPILER